LERKTCPTSLGNPRSRSRTHAVRPRRPTLHYADRPRPFVGNKHYADIVAASRAAAGLVVSRALAGAFTLMPLIAMAAGRHG